MSAVKVLHSIQRQDNKEAPVQSPKGENEFVFQNKKSLGGAASRGLVRSGGARVRRLKSGRAARGEGDDCHRGRAGGGGGAQGIAMGHRPAGGRNKSAHRGGHMPHGTRPLPHNEV